MGKKNKKKYYAIKKGKGVTNIIVTDWKVCSELVLGYNASYKSFLTEDEAKNYLGNEDNNLFKEQTTMNLSTTNKEKLIISKVKEKSQKIEKVKREYTKKISVNIPKNVYFDFQNKCIEMELDKDKIIKNMILEWLY